MAKSTKIKKGSAIALRKEYERRATKLLAHKLKALAPNDSISVDLPVTVRVCFARGAKATARPRVCCVMTTWDDGMSMCTGPCGCCK